MIVVDEQPVNDNKVSEVSVEGLTPLAGYAHSAHEMFTCLLEAGFTEEWAMAVLLEKLPDWEFPIPTWDCEEEDFECDCDDDDEEDEEE
jgi:hypothetical protein